MLRPPLVGVDGLDHPWSEFAGGEVASDRVPPDLPRHWPLGSFAHLRSSATPIPVIDRAGSVPYLRRVSKLDIITLPDRKLRMKSVPVERVDDELRAFMDSMV